MAHSTEITAIRQDQSDKDIIYLRAMINIYEKPQPRVALAMKAIVDGLENFNNACFEDEKNDND